MSEKNTDHFMQSHYQSVFNVMYHTEGNNDYFNSKIPDGWDIIDNAFIIIENKKLNKQKKEGRDQLFSYYDNLPDNVKSTHIVYLILGLGNTEKTFKTIIYDNNKTELDITLEDIKKQINQPTFDKNEIHNLNQYLYDNSITLSKSQKTLFVAAILICLKIDKEILSDYEEGTNNYLIADKMISVIDNYYEDKTFSNMFSFIKKSIHNRHIYHIFNLLTVDIKKYGKDILNEFYSEFCAWDRNNDALLGIVLTPDDIVEIMITKSFNYYYQFNNETNQHKNIKLIDFCTGTGSFLIKGSKFTNLLYGCECGDERYSLAKCNFILNNLDYSNLKYESCFNVNYHSNYFDVSIINPPFSNRCQDELNGNDMIGWRNYDQEQKFIMYQVELLRENGIGCCIVPRSNFNNNIKCTNEFKQVLLNNVQVLEIINCNSKVFVPNANVECAILIYRKIKINDYQTKIIDYSDDGYKIKKGVRYYDHQPITKEQLRTLKYDDDWNYQKEGDKITTDIMMLIDEYNIDFHCSCLKTELRNKIYDDDYDIMEFKLSDILEIISVKTFSTEKTTSGDIPLYGATQLNDPVKRVNELSFNTNKSNDPNIRLYGVLCINKTGNGGAGICFKRRGRFSINPSIMVCKMKYYLTDFNCGYLSYQLHKIFNRSNTLSINKFNSTKIKLLTDTEDIKIITPEYIRYSNIKEWKEFKIGDLMNLLPNRKLIGNKETPKGQYPLVSTGQNNHGIIRYVNEYEYDGENNKYITCAMTGSSGSSFYQPFKFMVTDRVRVLEIKKDIVINPHLISLIMNHLLTSKYSYTNGLSINKLMNEIIKIPIFE